MAHPLLRLAPLFGETKGLLAAGLVGLTVGTSAGLVGPWIVGQAIDVDLASGDFSGLVTKAAVYAATLAFAVAFTYVSRIALEIAAQRAMVRLKAELFAHLVGHDLAFHDRHPSGRLITRVQGDTEALRVLFTEVILAAPADIALFAGMFVILAFTAPQTIPILFAVIPPYIGLFLIFRMVSPPRFLALRAVKAELTGFLTEHVRAMPTLRLFNRGAWARGRGEELNRDVFWREVSAQIQPVWYFNAVFMVRKLGIVGTLFFGGILVANGSITVGVLVMGLAYLRQMFGPLMRLSHHLSTLERARAAAIRISGILDSEPTITDPAEPAPWPGLTDALRLEGVHFHYDPDAPVLKGIDLTVPAGGRVGIVGATGAGKSTVLNLLLRFRDPIAGRVTVDGVDVRHLGVEDLRSRIGLVLQDVHLFPGTVLENLGDDAARATAALDTVGLDIGLDHVLAEGGQNLSRGERQLLTFARALVDDPRILVLDEATSAVDPATEARVQAALARVEAGRTTITVAHRLATVERCDTIYVLAHGEVQEVGSHAELLARNGIYAALAQLQGLAA